MVFFNEGFPYGGLLSISQNLMTLNTFRCSSLHVFTEEDINKSENKCDQCDLLKSRN